GVYVCGGNRERAAEDAEVGECRSVSGRSERGRGGADGAGGNPIRAGSGDDTAGAGDRLSCRSAGIPLPSKLGVGGAGRCVVWSPAASADLEVIEGQQSGAAF